MIKPKDPQADRAAKEKQQEKESQDILNQLDRMRVDRTELLHGAHDLTAFLEGFENGYNSSALEEFPSPEELEALLQDIEFQKEKSIQALTEISRSMDKLGHSSNTDLTVEEDVDETKETKKIGEEHNKSVAAAAVKLAAIFSKSKKIYTDVLHSFTTDDMDMDADVKADDDANVEQALIPMLQQKIVHLKKDLELARMKAQSLQVQWTADKTKYEDILMHNKQDITTISQKLVVAESKRRYREQTERDENMVVESVSKVEYNYVVSEMEALKLRLSSSDADMMEKKATIEQLNNEVQLKMMDIANLDRKVVNLEQRLDLSNQAKDYFQKKHEESVAEFEKKLSGLKEQLDKQRKDQMEQVEENAKLKRDLGTLQDQISSLKRENDEYFRFLHKAEDDNKFLRSQANDLQAKLVPALAEKEEIEKRLSAKLLELMTLQADLDTTKGQLWKVINSTKTFSKNFKRGIDGNPIEDLIMAQQRRLSNLEKSLSLCSDKFSHVAKHRDTLIRDRNKDKMMQQFADAQAVANATAALSAVASDDEEDEEETVSKPATLSPEHSSLAETAVAEASENSIELAMELDRLKRSEAKKTSQLQAKEAELANTRKAMEMQRGAMESQKKVMESQKKHLEDKILADAELVRLRQEEIASLHVELNGFKETVQQSVVNLQQKSTDLESAKSSLLTVQNDLQSMQVQLEAALAAKAEADAEVKRINEEKEIAVAAAAAAAAALEAKANVVSHTPVSHAVSSASISEGGDGKRSGVVAQIDMTAVPLGSDIPQPSSIFLDMDYVDTTLEASLSNISSAIFDVNNISNSQREQITTALRPFLSVLRNLAESISATNWIEAVERSLTSMLASLSAMVLSTQFNAAVVSQITSTSDIDLQSVAESFSDSSQNEQIVVNAPPAPEDIKEIQEELFKDGGVLENVHKISSEDFDWLVTNKFADIDLSKLAFYQYQLDLEAFDSEDVVSSQGGEKGDVEALHLRLLKQIASATSFYDLGKYYRLTVERIALMNNFSAWKSLSNCKDGGIFTDVLVNHLKSLKLCIAAKGGWKGAFEEVQSRADPTEDTKLWPEFFRVRVLEYYCTLWRDLAENAKAENMKLLEHVERHQVDVGDHGVHRRHSHSKQHAHSHAHGHRASHLTHQSEASEESDLLEPLSVIQSTEAEAVVGAPSRIVAHHDVPRHHRRRKSASLEPQLQTAHESSNSEHFETELREGKDSQEVVDSSAILNAQEQEQGSGGLANTSERSETPKQGGREASETTSGAAPFGRTSSFAGVGVEQLPASPRTVRDTILHIAAKRSQKQQDKKRRISDRKLSSLSGKGSFTPTIYSEVSESDLELVKDAEDSVNNPTENTVEGQVASKKSSLPALSLSSPIANDEGEDHAVESEDDITKAIEVLKQRQSEQAKTVKGIARETLKKQISVRRETFVDDSEDLGDLPFTSAAPLAVINESGIDAKLDTALSATNSLMTRKLKQTVSKIGDSEQSGALVAIQAVHAVTSAGKEKRKSQVSLHKLADEVGFILLGGDENTEILVELVLEAIDSWRDGYKAQALDMIEMSHEYCSYPQETTLMKALKIRVKSSLECPEDVIEVADKFHSLLAFVEENNYSESESGFPSRAPSAVQSSGRQSRIPSAMSARGTSPQQIDALMNSLQDNRIKRLQDREEAQKITTTMKGEVAEVIANALSAVIREGVEIGTQTDSSMELVSVVPISDAEVFDEDGAANTKCSPRFGLQELQTNQEASEVSASNTFSTIMASLPPGFQLVRIGDGQLELCPGVYLASYTRLSLEERSSLPRGIAYCFREPDAAYGKGLKRVPRYVLGIPKVPNCEAVLIPRVFKISEEVTLIMDYSLEAFTELPPDVYVIQTSRNCVLPDGITVVELSSLKEIPFSITIPDGLELVQVHLAVALPPGVLISPECEIVAQPFGMPPLPHNVQLIKRAPGSQLPSFMTLLATTSKDETEIILHSKMEDGCTVLKRPPGVDFGLGIEIISRPAGHALPVGMTPVPVWAAPRMLRLSGTLELVQLTPRFDFPVECRPAPNWLMFPRPTGIRLPPNTYLVLYEGERGGGILPDCMRRVHFPEVPYGVQIPKNVIAVEFLPGAGTPLPYGTTLCEGVTVLSPKEGVIPIAARFGEQPFDLDDIIHNLPLNGVLVRRQPGSIIPMDVERASGGSLPHGIRLGPNIEIWKLSVRFELPAGVKLEAGATLGRNTQLPPGTILSRDLEVQEWPRGLKLDLGTELVRISPGCDLPIGFSQMMFSRSELQSFGLTRDCMIVRLPHVIRLMSTQQLSEKVTVLAEPQTHRHKESKSTKGDHKRSILMSSRDPKVESVPVSVSEHLPSGCVFILRDSKRFQIPSEMSSLPKGHLSQEVKNILTDHNVALPSDVVDKSRPSSRSSRATTPLQTEKTYLDVVSLEPCFRFPVGVEIAPGVVVQNRPHYLQNLPRWVELVSISSVNLEENPNTDPVKIAYGKKLLSKLKYMRSSLRAEVNPFLGTPYELPIGTELIVIPHDIKVFSWGPHLPGIEAVVQPPDIWLPRAHFLIERPRGHEPPVGVAMGFAPEYSKLASRFRLPPGIEVMHIVPTFHLPMGVDLISTDILTLMPCSKQSIPGSLKPCIEVIQLCNFQQISPGVLSLAYPFGWQGVDELLSVGGKPLPLQQSASVDGHNRWHSGSWLFLFVWIDPQDFTLPDGCELIDQSDSIVMRYFNEYSSFGADHAGHKKKIAGKRRFSFDEPGAVLRRRSLRISPGEISPSLPSDSGEIKMLNSDSSSGVHVTDVIKFIKVGNFLPGPRERFRQNTEHPVAVKEEKSTEQDQLTVHPRVSVITAAPDEDALLKSPEPEPSAAPPISATTTETEALPTIVSDDAVAKASTIDAPAVVIIPDVVVPPPVQSSTQAVSLVVDTSETTEVITGSVDTVLPNPEEEENFAPHQSPPRPVQPLRFGITNGIMGVEGGKPPDIDTLLVCLEKAQEEIDHLQDENNSYRSKTIVLQREIDYLKSKLDRMNSMQKTKQEEFASIREQITELKGLLANAHKTMELRDKDTASMKKKLEEKLSRHKTQIDILTSQLAHWTEASSDIVALSALHKKEVEELHKKFSKKLKRSLEKVLSGSRVLVSVLVDSLREMISGALTEMKLQSIQAAAEKIPLLQKFGLQPDSVMSDEDSAFDSVLLAPAPVSHMVVEKREVSDDASVTSVGATSVVSVSSSTSSISDKRVSRERKKSSALGFLHKNPLKQDFKPSDFIPLATKVIKSSSQQSAPQSTETSVLPHDHHGSHLHHQQHHPNIIDSKLLGLCYLRGASRRSDGQSLEHNFLMRLDNIVLGLQDLQEMCGGRRPKKAFMASTSGEPGDPESAAAATISGENEDGEATVEDDQSADSEDESLDPSAEVADEASDDEADENDETKLVVEKMKKLSTDMRPMMASWVTDVLEQLKHISKQERAVYLKALQMSDIENHASMKRVQSCNRKLHELESKLIDCRRNGEGFSSVTSTLHEKINALEGDLDRMKDIYMEPVLKTMQQQIAEYAELIEIEKSLLFQALSLKKLADKEERDMATKVMESAESQAVKHHITKLRTLSTKYEDRAAVSRASKTQTLDGILADLETYHKAINDVIPSNLLPKLLTWGSIRHEESDRKADAEQEIARMSPTRGEDGDRRDRDAKVAVAPPPLPADLLESAQHSLKQPLNKVRFGSTGTMPPAPARSVFNLNNTNSIEADYDQKPRLKSKSKKERQMSLSADSLADVLAAAASNSQKTKLKPIKPTQLLSASQEAIYRGGITGGASASGHSSLTLPSIGLTIQSVQAPNPA